MKKLLIIVCAILIVTVVACLLPIPSSFSETLSAAKLDAQGNTVCTVQIPLQGTKSRSLLQTKLREVKIGAFDGLAETEELHMSQFKQDPMHGYWKVSLGAADVDFDLPTPENPSLGTVTENSYLYTLAFCEEFDRWCIHISSGNAEEAFYVGSISGNYSIEELTAYFNGLAPDSKLPAPGTAAYEAQLPISINWDMHAYLISPDGSVVNTYSITVSGDIREGSETANFLYLTIDHPNDLRYWFKTPENGYAISLPKPTDKSGDFSATTYVYDKVDNVAAACQYALNTEKEYFFAYWGDNYGYYLVACTDPNAAPADILEHYSEFLELVRFD